MIAASRLVVRGAVQGVGFRPFVARLAEAHGLAGWVLNAEHGVEIHVEGQRARIDAFARSLSIEAPPAAAIDGVDRREVEPSGLEAFEIRDSRRLAAPSVRIAPDLPVCGECLAELFGPSGRRSRYPYINCTNCGPRYSIVRALPYDRSRTTMAAWPLCADCDAEYRDPRDRRFHAEPVACSRCGPVYRLIDGQTGANEAGPAIAHAVDLLRRGSLVAIKGVGGYHLCCDALNEGAVTRLRERKFRKSQPFAVMTKNLDVAKALVHLDGAAEEVLVSPARPIVLTRARTTLPGVAPHRRELGIMLPYAPIHYLLFEAGAPDVVVMTSANRSTEPIAFEDDDALRRLSGIADAFLVGDRPIARRVDDSVVRIGASGPIVLRRARGYAPSPVARFDASRPILAVGADLKNTITLVVEGQAMMSQHVGDLEHLPADEAFRATVRDLMAMYDVDWGDVIVAHDAHPHYASTQHALQLHPSVHVAVQHHRAHVASVLAERGALSTPVVGVAFDGTGYGDDGTIWGGEFFVGSVRDGFSRVASLHPFALPGGDAASRWPVQACAGLLFDVGELPDLLKPPFCFPERYDRSRRLVEHGLRTFACTSAGRLFDGAAALLGFTGEIEYEGQAASWLEQLAWEGAPGQALPYALTDAHLDYRDALHDLAIRRLAGEDEPSLARAFHDAIADGIVRMARRLCHAHRVNTVVLSGGTFQNTFLLERIQRQLAPSLAVWTNMHVPPNDGGISLGQAAIAVTAST